MFLLLSDSFVTIKDPQRIFAKVKDSLRQICHDKISLFWI